MTRIISAFAVLAFSLLSSNSASAEVTRTQVNEAIERGVKAIVALQADDGRWPYMGKAAENPEYVVGHSALMVLALQHSRSRLPEASLAIKKGLNYILQHEPEPKTYTAGLVQQVLYYDSSTEHNKWISAYAWMLISGQRTAVSPNAMWTYALPPLPPDWARFGPGDFHKTLASQVQGDHSNSQFGILGLVYAEKAGYQVPRVVWERARDHYVRAQFPDGGWGYYSSRFTAAANNRNDPTMSMTLAGTVSVYLCEEALADKSHKQCETPLPNAAYEAGLKWIADNWDANRAPYGWYACERLGLLTGLGEFAGHDWYQEGAEKLLPNLAPGRPADENTAFIVLFLSRGRVPIIINKLKRKGDWNLHRYDISHLIDHISGPWQTPCQWRIVTLDAKIDFLLKVPILWISGHESLKFTPEEKAKLKEYVEKGGTILAEDCCSKPAFNSSCKALLKELWPENALNDLPKTHAIYTSFRRLESKPNLMAMALDKGQGRLGVIYIPNGISCRWEVGGPGAKGWLDVGACIYLYVDKMNKQFQSLPEPAPTPTPTPAPPVKPDDFTPTPEQ